MTRKLAHCSLGVLLGALLAAPLAAQAAVPSLDKAAKRAQTDVKVLAADELGGRLTGTAGADSAAAYVARRFAQVGLQPPPGGWFQPFTVSKDAPAVQHANLGDLNGKNVIGILPGRDPVPLKVLAVDGDSVATEAGPYASAVRKDVQVTTRTVMRLVNGAVVGRTVATYTDGQVLQLTTEGTRQ